MTRTPEAPCLKMSQKGSRKQFNDPIQESKLDDSYNEDKKSDNYNSRHRKRTR